MRVLAATTAGTGHFQPMVPVLEACAERGDDVLVGCPDSFAERVGSAGFACAPFDDAPRDDMSAVFGRLAGMSYDGANRVVVGEVFATLDADAALPRLAATIERWRPDVIVRDPSEFASWLLAERRHVPHLRVAIGLLSSDASYAGVAAAALAAAAEASGLPPDPGGRRLIDGPVIAAAPPTFDPAHGMDPQRVHRYASPLAAPGALPPVVPRGEDPLVYVTFGTVAASLGLWPTAYRMVIDALADAPVRVVMTTGFGVDPSPLGPLPPHMAVTEFVPQDAVLPHTAVLVTHGGYGTVLGGVRAGVPMVVTPMFADQSDNASRVASTGVGVHVQLSPEPMTFPPGTAAAVRAAVLRLLDDDDAREAAQRLAREMAAQPPVERMVAVIAEAAGG